MSLTIEKRQREGILILTLVGQLAMGRDDEVFRAVVQSCIAARNVRIILECSRLRNIDSAGLDTLVFFQTELGRAAGKIVLLNMTRTHTELFLLAKLDVLFEVFTDEQSAINSFFPERALLHWDVLTFVEAQSDPGLQTTHDERPFSGIPNI